MKNILTLLFFTITFSVFSQKGESYYVNSGTLNLREEANTQSDIIEKLHQYDNIRVLESIENGNWFRIQFDGVQGYVSGKYVKRGRAVVETYEIRTGAKCRDGSSSSATGRGACSHHGGVSYWVTETKKNVDIIEP